MRSEGKKVEDFFFIDTTVWVSVHAPQFFKGIQESNGITTEQLIESLRPKRNHDNVFKSGEGAG